MQIAHRSIDHSDDVHHQETLLRAWDQDYAQLHPGRFIGSVDTLRNGPVALFREAMNRATFQMGALPPDRLAFGLSLRAKGQSRICGEDGGEDSLLVFSGKSGFEFRSPEDFEFYGIDIDTTGAADPVFCSMVGALSHFLSSGRRAIPLDRKRAARLGQLLRANLSEDGIHDRLQDDEDHALTFNRSLVGALLDILPTTEPETRRQPMRHWDTVTAIRHLVKHGPCCPSSVAELTVELGISRRTLQNACQETVGLGPVQFLRALRLSEARRALIGSVSVTEAAMQFGFWHLGYFARGYHAMFGELPSKTLERHRSRLA